MYKIDLNWTDIVLDCNLPFVLLSLSPLIFLALSKVVQWGTLINISIPSFEQGPFPHFYSEWLPHLLTHGFALETWLNIGELSPFSELFPSDCNSLLNLSSPWKTSQGGGLATVYENCFNCQQLTADVYPSFELQLFEIKEPTPLLCALVYQRPKLQKNFI